MGRNASGDYSLPLPDVSAGNPIQSSWANTTLDDLAASMTDSLDRNGRGTMNAPFLNQSGTLATPGISWGAEPSSGFYRPGTIGEMNVSILGQDVFRWIDNGGSPKAQIWTGTVWRDVLYGDASGGGTVPGGTATSQSLSWNGTAWIANSTVLIDTTNNDAFISRDLTVNRDIIVSGNVDGVDVSVLNGTVTSHIGGVVETGADIHYPDVDIDGIQYVRQDKSWVAVAPIGEVIPSGTVEGQSLYWDNTGGSWVNNSNLIIDSVNNRVGVGVGVLAPADTLHAKNTTTTASVSADSGGGDVSVFAMKHGGALTSRFLGQSNGNMLMQTNGTTEAMRVTDQQRVGIGETAPAGLLDVGGDIYREQTKLTEGFKWMEVRAALPVTPDADTLYFLTS